MVKHQIFFPIGHVKKNCENTIRTLFDQPARLEIGVGGLEAKLVKYCIIMGHIILLTTQAIVFADSSPQCGLISAIVPASVCSGSLTTLPFMTVIFMSLLAWIGMEGEVSNRQLRYTLLMFTFSVVNFLNHWLSQYL